MSKIRDEGQESGAQDICHSRKVCCPRCNGRNVHFLGDDVEVPIEAWACEDCDLGFLVQWEPFRVWCEVKGDR